MPWRESVAGRRGWVRPEPSLGRHGEYALPAEERLQSLHLSLYRETVSSVGLLRQACAVVNGPPILMWIDHPGKVCQLALFVRGLLCEDLPGLLDVARSTRIPDRGSPETALPPARNRPGCDTPCRKPWNRSSDSNAPCSFRTRSLRGNPSSLALSSATPERNARQVSTISRAASLAGCGTSSS